MVHILEVTERAYTGTICSEQDFDLKILVPKLNEVIAEYEINYNPETIIPSDNKLADAVFEAALDLYSSVGTYSLDTERIIQFDENEIKKAIRNAPFAPIFGEGNDRRTLKSRKPEDKKIPWCFIGAGGAPVSNDKVFTNLVQSYGMIKEANSITTPSLTSINGIKIRSASPIEIYGAIKAVNLARFALKQSGRPGLPIMNCIATAESGSGTIAASGPQFGLRSSDGWLVGAMPELKIDFDRLNKVAYLLNWGANIGAETSPLLGGYAGGPAGTAIINATSHIQSIMVHNATYHLTFPLHLKWTCSTPQELLWTISLSGQAISRNSHLPTFNLGYVAAGPMTEMCYYETAAWVTAAVTAGLSIEAEGVAKAVAIDHFTPLEPKFAIDVAYATTGMKRSTANDIVKDLLELYAPLISNPPIGKSYQECFNLETGKPNEESIKFMTKISSKIQNYGINLI